MADNEQVKTKRDITLARLQEKYPDNDFTDDEAIYGRINDDYDECDRQIGEFKDRDKVLSDMFASDPRSADFLMKWKEGADPAIALIEEYGDDIEEVLHDPEKRKEVAEAKQEYLKKVAKEKEYTEIYQQNLKESLENLEKYQQEKGLSDEDTDNALSYINQLLNDALLGKISPETIEMAMKAQHYDTAVAEAEEAGEVKGRNTKIEEKLRKKAKGDGTANLDGKNNGKAGEQPMPELGALNRYDDGLQNIWERGGFKRRKY